MSDSGSVPSSWSELLAQVREQRAGNEEFLRDRAEALADNEPKRIANKLGVPAESLAELAVGLGVQTARPLFELFQPSLPVALKGLAGSPGEHLIKAMGVLRYVSVARCCGVAVPAEASAVEKQWLPALAAVQGKMVEKESYSMAFAALAVGAFDQVPTFIGGGALPASIEPGQTFQLNVEKFVRYLAAAAAQGKKADDVRPAFEEFVQIFPLKLGAQSLGWIELLNAARAFYVHFEGRPVETVAQTLHELVTRLASAE